MIVYQTPSMGVFHNRQRFHATQRAQNENISDWFKRLQKFNDNCEFQDVSDYMLIDKFISGLNDSDFDKVSQIPHWTVEELVLVVIGNAHIFNIKKSRGTRHLHESFQSHEDELTNEQNDNRESGNDIEDVHIKMELITVIGKQSAIKYHLIPNENVSPAE